MIEIMLLVTSAFIAKCWERAKKNRQIINHRKANQS